MHGLTAQEIISVWEAGQRKHPLDRALALLALACPEMSADRLRALPVGRRNTLLLLLRQEMLGARTTGIIQCPNCYESLELEIDTTAFLAASGGSESGPLDEVYDLAVEDYAVRFRVPTSLDLAEVARCRNHAEGRQLLIARCVVETTWRAQPIVGEQLPENALQALAEAISERDPLAEIDLSLNCSACQHSWTAIFDIASFFWTELEAQARRLLRDVHTIASAYGWSERDILALGAARRQFYLEAIY